MVVFRGLTSGGSCRNGQQSFAIAFVRRPSKRSKLAAFIYHLKVIAIDPGFSTLTILFAVAVFGAFISSIAGAGGLIVLPVLLWMGVPPVNALATNKVQSVFGTLSSAFNYFRNGQIQFDTLVPAMLWALPGAVAGTLMIQSMDAGLLESLLPFMLIVVALYLGFSPRISDENSAPRMGKHSFGFLIGGGVGFYGGFFGPGMGSFCAAAFAGLRGYNMRRATGHTKPLVLMTNLVSTIIFIAGGHVLWKLALVMAVGQVIGARLGSALVLMHGARLVKPVIITLTLVIAVKLLYD